MLFLFIKFTVRYPELDILEITEHAEELEVVKLDSLIVKIKSVQVANVSLKNCFVILLMN